MTLLLTIPGNLQPTRVRKILWAVFILYILLSALAISHHEVWGDEVHSWNIAKGSGSYFDMIQNSRYEGHPPGWYTILWSISKFSHDVMYMKMAHWVLAVGVVFMILFCSPFPLFMRIMIPFGYYFLFEYAAISRNYALGVLLACCICLIMRRDFRGKLPLYYALLFCMSNVHLLNLILAGSLHVYFLANSFEQKKGTRFLVIHTLLGGLILLPAVHFIFPPNDSQLNIHFWFSHWSPQSVNDLIRIPIRSFLPIPAWWKHEFWNTEFILQASSFTLTIGFILMLLLLATVFFLFRREKKSLLLFVANLLVTYFVAALFFQLSSSRYSGFIFISAIIAAWLYCYDRPIERPGRTIIIVLLTIQMVAGIFAVSRDYRQDFSNLYKVNELLKEVPHNQHWVTDYWAMNGVVAFTDRPAYCIDMQREISFVLWDGNMKFLSNPRRLTDGFQQYFRQTGSNSVYYISLAPAQQLSRTDTLFSHVFRQELVDKREGAIEKGSNLYLYKISQQ